MSRFYSEALGKHDRKAFASGQEKIDSYFHKVVSQDVKRKYANCYVLIEKTSEAVAGFYTLSATNFPVRVRRRPQPVAMIAANTF